MAVLIAVGFILAKKGKLSKKTAEDMTFFVFKIATPCVIIKSFIEVDFTAGYFNKLIMATIMAVITHLLGFLFGLIFNIFCDCKTAAVYRFGCLISNAGFIALPLAQAVLGAESVLLVGVYIIILNIFTWTLGKAYFDKDKKPKISAMLINPGTIGAIGGIIAVLIKSVYMPQIILSSVNALAAVNMPVAMIITGYYLVGTDMKSVARDKLLWLTVAIRHIVLPCCAMLLYRYLLGVSSLELCSAIIPACAPCAVIVIMFAASFGGDEKEACKTASVSTVLSIVTMPLILSLCSIL